VYGAVLGRVLPSANIQGDILRRLHARCHCAEEEGADGDKLVRGLLLLLNLICFSFFCVIFFGTIQPDLLCTSNRLSKEGRAQMDDSEFVETSDQELLRKIVIENSEADDWKHARLEWSLSTVFFERSHCICKHSIYENCVIFNSRTGNTLTVGNNCISHFERPELQVAPGALRSLRKLQKDFRTNKANDALLDVATRIGVIGQATAQKYSYYGKGKGSRKRYKEDSESFNSSAFDIRASINAQIVMGLNRNRPTCSACATYMSPYYSTQKERGWYYCKECKTNASVPENILKTKPK
jgi:hypothetical protein